jgi:hypothetical protein
MCRVAGTYDPGHATGADDEAAMSRMSETSSIDTWADTSTEALNTLASQAGQESPQAVRVLLLTALTFAFLLHLGYPLAGGMGARGRG